MKDNQKLERRIFLIKTSLEGELSVEEKEELETWLEGSEENRNSYERIRSKQLLSEKLKFYEHTDSEADWKEIRRKIGSSKKVSLRWWRYAAVFAGLFVATGILYLRWERTSVPGQVCIAVHEDTIRPGSRQAYIELVNGEKIALGEQEKRLFRNVEGGVLTEEENGVVRVGVDLTNTEFRKVEYNRIVVPRGGEYQLILADGTKVWLNSDSRLEFPVAFAGSERRVKLYGEAYFNVAKNEQLPFHVEVNQTEVTVLGTSFNILAYGDYTRTTLEEGRVAVNALGRTYQIMPGEEINVESGRVTVEKVDVYERIAWKDGKFVFRDKPLEEVMDILGRWYDVKIVYQDAALKDLHFTGNVPRHVTIDKVLRFLEHTRLVHFNVEGRTVQVFK